MPHCDTYAHLKKVPSCNRVRSSDAYTLTLSVMPRLLLFQRDLFHEIALEGILIKLMKKLKKRHRSIGKQVKWMAEPFFYFLHVQLLFKLWHSKDKSDIYISIQRIKDIFLFSHSFSIELPSSITEVSMRTTMVVFSWPYVWSWTHSSTFRVVSIASNGFPQI